MTFGLAVCIPQALSALSSGSWNWNKDLPLTRTPTVQKADVENHFNTHGTGKILETKLMNGFGFLEYEDALDARDVVPCKPFDHVDESAQPY